MEGKGNFTLANKCVNRSPWWFPEAREHWFLGYCDFLQQGSVPWIKWEKRWLVLCPLSKGQVICRVGIVGG